MKDAGGHEYSELLAIQRDQLRMWHGRLKQDCYAAVAGFCVETNLQANGPEGKHRVHRGQDIVQLVMEWPTFNPLYFPPKKPVEILVEPAAQDLI